TNYHGPLHFYVLLLSQSLFGRNLWALRLPVVLVSIGCVWLILKFEPLVGRNVSRIAALAMAVSPGFVFYGRYAIHEVWLEWFLVSAPPRSYFSIRERSLTGVALKVCIKRSRRGPRLAQPATAMKKRGITG